MRFEGGRGLYIFFLAFGIEGSGMGRNGKGKGKGKKELGSGWVGDMVLVVNFYV